MRVLLAPVVKVVLRRDLLDFGSEALPGAVARPQSGGRRKGIEAEIGFPLPADAGAVVKHEAVAVRRKHEWDVDRRGIFEALLHPVADTVIVVLLLDDRDGDVRLNVEYEVRFFCLAATEQLAANDDAPLGAINLLANAPSRANLRASGRAG